MFFEDERNQKFLGSHENSLRTTSEKNSSLGIDVLLRLPGDDRVLGGRVLVDLSLGDLHDVLGPEAERQADRVFAADDVVEVVVVKVVRHVEEVRRRARTLQVI